MVVEIELLDVGMVGIAEFTPALVLLSRQAVFAPGTGQYIISTREKLLRTVSTIASLVSSGPGTYYTVHWPQHFGRGYKSLRSHWGFSCRVKVVYKVVAPVAVQGIFVHFPCSLPKAYSAVVGPVTFASFSTTVCIGNERPGGAVGPRHSCVPPQKLVPW